MRPGDHPDGEGALRLGDAGDHRGATGAGAPALAGGDEHHVGALEDLFQLLGVVLGRLAADLGVGAGAEPAGQLAADVQLDVGVGGQQRLGVGVDGDELHALEARLDHAVDGVDTTAADPDHLDHGQVVLRRRHHPTILLRPFSSGVVTQAPGPGRRGKLPRGPSAMRGCRAPCLVANREPQLEDEFRSPQAPRDATGAPVSWSTTSM
jgi:hypothetical protein